MQDDVLKYNPAGIADYTHALATFAGEFENVRSQCLNLLAGLHEYFDTHQASISYVDAQNLINQGIDEGQQVIMRHGNAVDTASVDFASQDAASAQTFYV